ncbi:MAG: bifunctional [glutamine synthetase] adenylyltransferase/[glutamine synthetase]-adenylyl-L-tyrosine phosphorylase [Alphaproteobacteria bacterium]|nr:bifunctional [glutamine synthetase] adenylyltransferase/[glutamine synthetase]-adenylyl-L-tyrosine phosphorylase [Alphaproteobacteria bacterium]
MPSFTDTPQPSDISAADRHLSAFGAHKALTPPETALLRGVFGNSPYLSHLAAQRPEAVLAVLEGGFEAAWDAWLSQMREECAAAENTAALMKALRIAKQRVALSLGVADIAGALTLEEVTGRLSAFAEAATNSAAAFLLGEAARKGEIVPVDPAAPAEKSGLIVLAMGKLGGGELNYSSDIDLIVFYDLARVTYTGKNTPHHFFVRLTNELSKILQERTAEGYVFRTDLRLRPDPASTPAAVSVGAAITYYETVGQNWERAAMIKARPIAGDMEAGYAFLEAIRPFVWRKYLDFASIEDIHSIKRQIDVRHGGMPESFGGYNVKLGYGGIREIEFFVQVQQLIWGGRIPELREKTTCKALYALVRAGKMLQKTAQELEEAYRFYRQVEHRLQMVADAQTHSLPENPIELENIARFCGFGDVASFSERMRQHIMTVREQYQPLFQESRNLGSQGNLVFTGVQNDPDTIDTLRQMGFREPERVSDIIRGWHHGRRRSTRTKRARELITELTPNLLNALCDTGNPDAAFLKFDEFLSRLPAGVQLFSLFRSNPKMLPLLARIMGSAPVLAELLSRKPGLLDTVLTGAFFDPLPSQEILLSQLLADLKSADHYEVFLDITRRFKQEKEFQIGVQVLERSITSEEAGRQLTLIAELVMNALLDAVMVEFIKAHGNLPGGSYAVVAFGKCGARELTFGSDIDLMFVYDAPPGDDLWSDGEKPLSSYVYFSRLTQRFTTALSTLTGEGRLYELDTRLRPHGDDGPPASAFDGLEAYYLNQAWVFEHMALTRARSIAGTPELQKKLDELFHRVLLRPREESTLRKHVLDMRERVERQHGTRDPWDVKYVRGGVIDIDYIVQYLQLLHGAEHPSIVAADTQVALIRMRKAGLLTDSQAQELSEASYFLRHLQALLRLTSGNHFREETVQPGLKRLLAELTELPDFEAVREHLLAVENTVIKYYGDFINI